MPSGLYNPFEWNETPPRRETIHNRRDRYRGALKITTPTVTEEQRKRWYGMPPSKRDTTRPGGTVSF
jgi:hypothetical protein